jgi:hypothetical protein
MTIISISTADFSQNFVTVKNDSQNSPTPAPARSSENHVGSQAEELLDELLSTVILNTSPSSGPESTTSGSEQVYGTPSISIHA